MLILLVSISYRGGFFMEEKDIKRIRKRMYSFAYIILLVFSLLGARLFWVSFIKGDEYSQAASSQRQKEVRLSMPRGMIYDRNLIPLTNREKQPTLFIFYKEIARENENLLEYIKENANMTEDEVASVFDKSSGVIEIPLKEDSPPLEENVNGVLMASKVERYHKDNLLSHVIGYVHRSEYTGESGIELAYENILKMDDENGLVSFIVDGKERPIPGMGVTQVIKDNSGVGNSVQLTVDYHIQKIVEEAMDSEGRNGAVVVAEVDTGDIVAMASRPNLNQDDVSEHEDSTEMDLYNKAIRVSYPPGSIFKIVVLLSALENDVVDVDEEFTCDGYEIVMGNRFDCSKADGHGQLNLKEAFAQSCNATFIQIGQRLGGKKIIETAEKLGFGKEISIGPLTQQSGRLPEGDDLLGPAIGLISIGQGKIEVTPLQVTNLVMTIANRGIKKDLSIIKGSLVSEDGHMIKPWNKDEDERVISTLDSLVLQDFMEEVFSNGTASSLRLDSIGGAAGKTGSAQAGAHNEIVHGWLSGYFPKDDPKYVITVFAEDGGSGGGAAGPIFEKIAKGISKLGK
ncbi:MAG: hypothetical protein FH761_14020 [Firmicutes bacterium]|nr:hypothetical protein [Bacillota bacterium]